MAKKKQQEKPRSTNPFDISDSSSQEDDEPPKPTRSGSVRSAPLDFNVKYDKDSAPALQFNEIQSDADFVSPLANALVEELGPHHLVEDQSNNNFRQWEEMSRKDSNESELSYLLGNTSNRSSRTKRSTNSPTRPDSARKSRSKWKEIKEHKVTKPRVLTELNTSRDEAEVTKDYYKMIRLENVGTAKSWIILLLPYFAVAICLILESSATLKIAQCGPIGGSRVCLDDNNDTYYSEVPVSPTPPDPCAYQYRRPADSSPLAEEQIPLLKKESRRNTTARGAAFESGVIATIPAAASELFADATFVGLSKQAMAAIYNGEVSVSGMLFERDVRSVDGRDQWNVVATSRTERLALACHFSAETIPSSTWTCNSPQIMEILFSMPGSAILLGNDLRINILYSKTHQPTDVDTDYGRTFLYGNDKLYNMLDSVEISHANDVAVLLEIVQLSHYIISYTNPLALEVDVVGRLIAIGITIGFSLFWLRRVGFQGFGSCSCSGESEEDDAFEIRQAMSFLDSPWVSFPERWYILVMLISLVFIQGPLVVLMYFKPSLNTVISLKTASDTFVGVGVNGVLFAYLCLFQGFGYHTARVTRKWMCHQKKIAEIRRAVTYVVGGNEDGDNEEAILGHTVAYFEMHGDTDGTASLVNLRLFHDPFGDNWADFLLPKLAIFFAGVASIWLTAYTRFHFTADATKTVSRDSLRAANTIYLSSYVVHFVILILWLALIFSSSMATGEKLRREPFLATRAAQLGYRVLFVHVTLGFTTLALLFFVWLEGLLKKWTGQTMASDSGTSMDFWLELIARVTQRFPYSGTAATIGLGRILFATVSILIAAFIFLPPKKLDNEEEQEVSSAEEKGSNPNREEMLRQRRDKRAVVSMLRATHTWRVLPLPMERTSAIEKIMSPQRFYQLYKSGEKDFNNLQDAGLVAIGKYVPVFCVELACWLHEASFQAYYSPKSVDWNDSTPGKMDLNSIGLRLESAILDDATNTQAFIATNTQDQVEGEEDSIIVVAFRGSVDASNIRTDLKSGMVALPDQLIGYDKAPFRVSSTDFTIEDSGGWIWKTQISKGRTVSCFSEGGVGVVTECLPFRPKRKFIDASGVSRGAMAVLSATPVARNTLPCIHEGFNEVYSAIRRKVIEALLPVLQRQLSKAMKKRRESRSFGLEEPLLLPKIFVTGHSLGGAIGQLMALDLASNCELAIDRAHSSNATNPANEVFQLPSTPSGKNPSTPVTVSRESSSLHSNGRLYLQPPIAVYTFGQPRVGNRAFSRLYKQKVPHTFRVATEGDPITALPHVACSGIYKHAGLEVVLDEGTTGNTLVGPTVVETLFRFHHVRTDFAAHSTDKYRDCLESALAPHELQEYYQGHSGKARVETGYGAVRRQATPEVPLWMTQGRSSLTRFDVD